VYLYTIYPCNIRKENVVENPTLPLFETWDITQSGIILVQILPFVLNDIILFAQMYIVVVMRVIDSERTKKCTGQVAALF